MGRGRNRLDLSPWPDPSTTEPPAPSSDRDKGALPRDLLGPDGEALDTPTAVFVPHRTDSARVSPRHPLRHRLHSVDSEITAVRIGTTFEPKEHASPNHRARCGRHRHPRSSMGGSATLIKGRQPGSLVLMQLGERVAAASIHDRCQPTLSGLPAAPELDDDRPQPEVLG